MKRWVAPNTKKYSTTVKILIYFKKCKNLFLFCYMPKYKVNSLPPYSLASLVAQWLKNPPATQDMWVWSLGWEDPLKQEMAILSSILAWRIPRTEEPGGLQSMGSQRVGHDLVTKSPPPPYSYLSTLFGNNVLFIHWFVYLFLLYMTSNLFQKENFLQSLIRNRDEDGSWICKKSPGILRTI